jgi:hypothetical protein
MRPQDRTASYRRDYWVAVLATIMLCGTVLAQTALPPNIEQERREKKRVIVLNRESKELAEEYADLLEELRDLTTDYQEYLADYQEKSLSQLQAQLEKLSSQLDDGSYAAEPDRLSSDLKRTEEQIARLQEKIDASDEEYPAKLSRLLRSLRREMESNRELLHEEMSEKMADQQIQMAAIEDYVRQVLVGLNIKSVTGPDGATTYYIETGPVSIVSKEGRRGEEAESVYVSLPGVHVSIPEPPEPPRTVVTPRASRAPGDDVGQSKTLNANMTVSSSRLPITVVSRMGDVQIEGSEEQQLTAELEIEVSGESRSMEKDFLTNTTLVCSSSNDGYRIEATIPNGSSRRLRVLNSRLIVTVPSNNFVSCENSYGNIQLSGLRAGVKVKGTYAAIDLSDITGGVTAATTMGAISISEVSGRIAVKTAYAPISVEEATGELSIENSYGAVSLSSCQGNATITNSGAVEVGDHTGDVRIRNSLGSVVVNGVSGNVMAVNAFQPISVENIKGTVTVENSNSAIQLSEISGMLSANNKFGQITGEALRGPVKLINQNGNILVELDSRLAGKSLIQTSFGNINVTLPRTANLVLDAQTTFGNVQSFLPLRIDDRGVAKSAAMVMGRGGDSLVLVGANASIFIDEKH